MVERFTLANASKIREPNDIDQNSKNLCKVFIKFFLTTLEDINFVERVKTFI